MVEKGIGADLEKIAPLYFERLNTIFSRATLELPKEEWMQSGGKTGRHTEHLGYILADLQYVQRAYPGSTW